MADPRTRKPTPGLRRFVARVALFLLPFALGATLLFALPLPRSFAWHFVRGDTRGRGVWIRDRVYSSPAPIDVAFVGTSATWYGVDDEAIERALEEAGRPLRVVNFGYGRNGRNLDFVIARDLLETREVRHLVVEVRFDENRKSHPVFGYVARTHDLLRAPVVSDADYLADPYRGLTTRLDLTRHRLLGLAWTTGDPDVTPHGVLRFPQGRAESVAVLDRTRSRRRASAAKREEDGGARSRRPRHYVRAIAALAARRGTQVHFLYLPTYGYPWADVRHRALYEELGDMWVPPVQIFRAKENWRDTDHLNRSGQAPLAAWLAERIGELDR